MFDLTTQSVNEDKKHSLFFVYLDEKGNIKSTDYELEISIDTENVDRQSIINSVLAMYNNNIINIRGMSKFDKITNQTLKCNQVTIKTKKSIIKKLDSTGAFFGSMKECVENSIKMDISNALYHIGNGGNISVKATERVHTTNSNTLNIISFGDDGFKIIRGKITHTYKDDYNSSCVTCIEGYKKYVENLNKINSYVVQNTDIATFEGDYITNFDIKDDKTIGEQIYQSLYPFIEMASIKSIVYERVA